MSAFWESSSIACQSRGVTWGCGSECVGERGKAWVQVLPDQAVLGEICRMRLPSAHGTPLQTTPLARHSSKECALSKFPLKRQISIEHVSLLAYPR